jgi:hypothetical protein
MMQYCTPLAQLRAIGCAEKTNCERKFSDFHGGHYSHNSLLGFYTVRDVSEEHVNYDTITSPLEC